MSVLSERVTGRSGVGVGVLFGAAERFGADAYTFIV
jgi:hypothetical protein